MSNKFVFTYHVDDKGLEITCRGQLDEHAKMPSLHLAGKKPVYINLKEVSYINSRGISIWVTWLRENHKINPSLKILLKYCPQVIMNQINAVVGFCPSFVLVDSLYVPYHCETCDFVEYVLLQKGVSYNYGTSIVDGQKVPCPKCAKSMSLDVLPQKYFQFLKSKHT